MEDTINSQNSKLLKQSLYTIQKLRKELDNSRLMSNEPIAVVGMACRFPGGCNSPEEYWELLKEGGECVVDIPEDRWNAVEVYEPEPVSFGKMYIKQSNFLKRDVSEFDAKFFKISPAEANSMDPQQRQLLETCWEALENAGQNPSELKGSQTGVFIGILSSCEYAMLPQEQSKVNQYIGTGTTSSIASGRISYAFGWNGPSLSLDTACSSSLVSTHLAVESLRRKECNMALSGGVNLMLSSAVFSNLCMMNAVSEDGRCKPFDATGSGYGRGEGCGILVLKRLSDAQRDGDTIYALIRGGAVNNDGTSSGLTVPNGKAQKMVISAALKASSVKPRDISYLEAHGTGTPLGDPIEIGAVTEIFGKENGEIRDEPLIIGAVKGNIGHLESAAGVASLIKVVLSLYHKEIPKIVNSNIPNPRINLDKIPAVLPREHMQWKIAEGKERIAGVSSFGFSGTNAHMVLSEAPTKGVSKNNDRLPASLLFLSAKDEKALIELITSYDNYFEKHQDIDIKDTCYVTNVCRPNFMHRAILLGNSLEDFSAGLKQILSEVKKEKTIYTNEVLLLGNSQGKINGATRKLFAQLNDNMVYTSKIDDQIQPKIVFLFSGNGDKILESAMDLYNLFPIFRDEVTACLKYFEPYYGSGLIDAFLKISDIAISQKIHYACVFSVEYAMMRLMESFDVNPAITFGERTGNYIALVTAGIISIESAVKHFVETQNAISSEKNIKYARVFIDKKEVEENIKEFKGKVFISAVYSPKEVVISGKDVVIEDAILKLTNQGIKVIGEDGMGWPSGMYEEKIDDFVKKIEGEVYIKPKLRYVSEFSGETIRNSGKLSIDFWEKNLVSPVQYDKALNFLYKQGYRFFVEIGSSPCLDENKILIYEKEDLVHIPLLQKENSLWELIQGMAKLLCLGCNINWKNFYKGYTYNKTVLPNYPFSKTKYWITPPSADSAFTGNDMLYQGEALKGREINLPYNKKQFEFTFTHKNLPELMDNSGVVHVGYFLEMIANTIRNIYGDAKYCIKDMEFVSPIMIFEEDIKDILLVLESDDDICTKFQFHSKNRNQNNWNLHVHGMICMEYKKVLLDHDLFSVEDIKSDCSEYTSGVDFYNSLDEYGFYFGPAVRWVDEIWHKDDEAIIRIRNSTDSEVKKEYDLNLHPGIIDSCGQIFNFISLASTKNGKKYMISNLDEAVFKFAKYSGELFGYIKIVQYNDERNEIKGNIRVIDETGKTIIFVGSVSLKEFNEEKLGAMKEVIESASASKDVRDKDFLLKYTEADQEYKVELLTQYLCNVLAMVVEIDPADLDVNEPLDNLGLDSMMGLRFHSKISRLFGDKISFVELIQARTVTKMAQMMPKFLPGGAMLIKQNDESDEEIENNQGLETWIYDFKPKSEAKIRIFCFPYGFGSADMYKEWQTKLGPEVDVCAIKLPGLDIERMNEKTPTDIDKFIDTLVDVLSESLFDIPCVSFGHSWGSLFAYRLAYKLSINPRANFVRLFVSGYTAPTLPNTSLMQIIKELKLLGINSIPTYEEVMETSSVEMVSKAFMEGWGVENERIESTLEGTKITLPLIISAYRIVEGFKFNKDEVFNIPIIGFHGIDDNRVTLDDMNAWEDVTTGTFKIYTMAGDHVFIDKSQSEARLIELLKEELFDCIRVLNDKC